MKLMKIDKDDRLNSKPRMTATTSLRGTITKQSAAVLDRFAEPRDELKGLICFDKVNLMGGKGV